MTACRPHPQQPWKPVCNYLRWFQARFSTFFLTIRGIEAQSARLRAIFPGLADYWPPYLEQKPLQLDLMEARPIRLVPAPFGKIALVPAGVYRQLALRLVPITQA